MLVVTVAPWKACVCPHQSLTMHSTVEMQTGDVVEFVFINNISFFTVLSSSAVRFRMHTITARMAPLA